jgi:hypothetical protein
VEAEIVNPDAGRLIDGLRDTGYEFKTAVADILDNSIAANATRIDVLLVRDAEGEVTFSVADNGDGMDETGLRNAMRYGSSRRPSAASLGKFGMGLKTASTAFCRCLSVISRNHGDAPLLMATWDLDYVVKEGEWKLQWNDQIDPDFTAQLNQIAPQQSGTVVVWQKVDRLTRPYKIPGGKAAQNAFERTEEELRHHIAKVYQRYLDPADKRTKAKVEITLNGEKVEPWDPFVTGFSELVAEQEMEVELPEGGDATFIVRAFVLPRRDEILDEVQRERAQITNVNQGVYVYRENRLIHDASWLGMFVKEPHGTLLRVEFSFDHRLDQAFQVDIKKSQILLNPALYDWLKEKFLTAPRRQADSVYREGMKKKVGGKAVGAHTSSNTNIKEKEAQVGGPTVSDVNASKNEVMLHNSKGEMKLKVPVMGAERPGEVSVKVSDNVPDGLLYRPVIIDKHRAVEISSRHPYYERVYVPNLERNTTVMGMDSLLWALAVAELDITSSEIADDLEQLRFTVSRMLRKLVENLPEATEDDLG